MNIIKRTRNQGGFTLLEVLLTAAGITILAGIVIVAINPDKGLSDSRNSQRSSDAATILDAVYQYGLDNNGNLPPTGTGIALSSTPTEICKTGGVCSALIDLNALTLDGKYLVALPIDPQCPTGCDTNGNAYMISKDAKNRVTVTAKNPEQGKVISVTR